MSDELLELYNTELNWFRRLSEEFSQAHPKVAGRLHLDKQGEDPHVSRLIEAFAFLNARLRLKLDDEFPELCQAFLNVLYPEYLNPIPSCGIVSFNLPTSQFSLKNGYEIAAHTEITTEPIDGEPCRFRTAYPVTLWPFSIDAAEVQTPPFVGPATGLADRAKGMVRISLKGFSPETPFAEMSLNKIRFFLNGESRYIYDLYELIMNRVTGIAVAASDKETEPVVLPANSISKVGFSVDECLLDYSPRSRLGFHLLTEFCSFPQKFLFFDLAIDPQTLARAGETQTMNLYFYLDEIPRNLENNIPASAFCLGATPMVNLFRQRAEPIMLKPTQGEYRVLPDARRPLANEVFSVDKVVAHADGSDHELAPFYSVNHPHGESDADLFWFANRRKVELAPVGKDHKMDLGTDVFLNLVGLDGKLQSSSSSSSSKTLDVHTTCLNRNYPNQLPRGSKLSLSGGDALVKSNMEVHPTETRRPSLNDQAHWRLISHLSLNHVSLVDDDLGATSLREMLRLYNYSGSRGVEMMFDGLLSSTPRRMVGRVGGSVSSGFCKGTEISLLLDETKFSGGGEYLFGSVLDHLLGMFTTINSFTKTVVRTQQGKTFDKWPLRTGDTELI
jgi:type VI secretion system protein ImpG